MGTNRTDLNKPLCGFGIPLNVPTSEPGDIGTDYTVASMHMGAFEPDGTTQIRFEAIGTPNTAKDLHIQTVRPGVASPDGMGIRYAETAVAGTPSVWYGADPISWRTGYQEVLGSTFLGVRVAVIRPQAGQHRMVAAFNNASACQCVTRGTDGTWGSAVTIGATVSTAFDLMEGPDGNLYAYVLQRTARTTSTAGTFHVYKSTDYGATWDLQTTDAFGTSFTLSTADRLTVSRVGAQVVAFTDTFTGGVHSCRQWASNDGGFTFKEVGTARSNFIVWDTVTAGGTVHAVTTEVVSSTDTYLTRRLSSAYTDVSNAPSYSHGAGSFTYEGGLCVTESGRLVLIFVSQASGGSIAGHTSTDGGLSWDDDGPYMDQASGMGKYPRSAALGWLDGQVLLITDTNTEGLELRFGGHTDFTVGADVDVVAASTAQHWMCVDSLTAGGWTDNSTGGSPTYTVNPDTGVNIATAFGVVAILNRSAISTRGIFTVVARVNSGTLTTTIGNTTGQITIDLTSTGIRAYDSGASAPSYDTHSVSDHVEFMAIFDDNAGEARVYWREWGTGHQRAWTLASAGITVSAGSYTAAFDFRLSTSSDCDIVSAQWAEPLSDLALSDGIDLPDELSPIYVSRSPTYLSNGVWCTSFGGLATIDGVTHTSTPTSPYRAANMNPRHAPSPRRVWRSADVVSDEVILFPVSDGPAADIIAVYVDNMVGIRKLDIDLGVSMLSYVADLRQNFTYDTGSKQSVYASKNANGSGTDRWVKPDELEGWYFETSGGAVYRVTGNTEGSIMGSTSPDEHQAEIFLASGALTPATGQAGYLYPNRALLLLYPGGTVAVSKFEITITAADQYDPGTGYRQIGLAALCHVHPFALAPDYNDSLDVDMRANVQETASGYRYSARRMPRQKRATIAWVESAHDVYAQHNGNETRDYFTVRTNGGNPAGEPAGGWTGVPYTIEGLHRRADGEPILWMPEIEYESTAITVWNVHVFGHDAIWGRLPDTFRREAVSNIGPHGYQTWRIPSLQITEEV